MASYIRLEKTDISFPSSSVVYRLASHGKGFESNQKIVGYSFNICATIAPFQKATNNKKQFLRLPASENSSKKVVKTETQGINTIQVADAFKSTSFLLKERHYRRWA
ncbi:hypothetical protein STEG23_013487, partial [Scotinomys teguina]